MNRTFSRLLALTLGLVPALFLAYYLVPKLSGGRAAVVGFRDGRGEMQELADFLGDPRKSFAGASRGPLGHLLLTEPIADRLFGIEAAEMIYDPVTYYRRPAFQERLIQWAEHPKGEWWMRTNSLGLRDDPELSRERPDLRVFVTGDSHTDGVCGNDESYPNQLEALLQKKHPDSRIEILNAGVGGYSFYNYLGAFERYIEFGMDVFVVGVYGGNDFDEVLTAALFFENEQRPARDEETWARIEKVRELDRPSIAQGFGAYDFFRQNPELEGRAVEVAVAVTLELERRCLEEGVMLVVAYIPPMYDVQWHLKPELWNQVRETFGLEPRDLEVTGRQADHYLAALVAEDMITIDLRAAFRAAEEPLYWLSDHHLNLAGHRRVSEMLLPLVGLAVPRERGR